MSERVDTVVVGAGHAGLAMSHVLTRDGIEHVVLERGRIGERWRSERWDSLTLLTPNWATWLPGRPYTGPDPDGFMRRDEVVAYLEAYAAASSARVRTGVTVRTVEPAPATDRFVIDTDAGELRARNVVIATGPFQVPRVPPAAAALGDRVHQLHTSRYRRPGALPSGAVLVVGTGASGQQIADELVAAGRKVYLSVGRHRRVPRSYRGRDYFWWLERTGYYDKTTDDVPPAARAGGASPALTGSRGGAHDLDLRRLAAEGATLLGRVAGVDGSRITFAPDLSTSLADGDRALHDFVARAEAHIDVVGEPVGPITDIPRHADPPEVHDPVLELDVVAADISTVIWATGFGVAFDWVRVPVFDDAGVPVHRRGVTNQRGLYFLGLHWLHRLRSAFIRGAEEDAEHLGSLIAADRA